MRLVPVVLLVPATALALAAMAAPAAAQPAPGTDIGLGVTSIPLALCHDSLTTLTPQLGGVGPQLMATCQLV
jgi:hypothetical protein